MPVNKVIGAILRFFSVLIGDKIIFVRERASDKRDYSNQQGGLPLHSSFSSLIVGKIDSFPGVEE